jgi:ABC-type sugar transport system substrate-binding protein
VPPTVAHEQAVFLRARAGGPAGVFAAVIIAAVIIAAALDAAVVALARHRQPPPESRKPAASVYATLTLIGAFAHRFTRSLPDLCRNVTLVRKWEVPMRRSSIALFLRSLDNDYQQRLRDDALAVAGWLGFTVKVMAAQNDSARQCAQIAEALAPPAVDDLAAVLVSAVRDDVLDHLAREAGKAGVGWVLLNREASYLENLRNEFPALPVFGVTPDQTEIGRIQAKQVKALLPQGGSVLCVTGPSKTSSSQRRLEGLKSELPAPYVVATLEADWTSEGARLAVDRWLEQPNAAPLPALVCAQNDEMALGVRQALRDAASRRNQPALAELPITGCDGSPALGQRLVRQKRLWATVALPSAAGPALEWLARWKDGADRPPVHVTLPVTSFPDLSALAPAGA